MAVENDYFIPFSKEEYDRRYRMLREAMKEKGLDCLLIYGTQSYGGTDLGQINTMYLACYAAMIHCYVVLPLKGDPTLVISVPYHLENAKDLSVIQDVRASGFDPEIGVGQRLKELGLEKGNIGIVGPTWTWFNYTIPVEHHNYLTKMFPKINFQTVSSWFEQLRLVKSEEEIKFLERAGVMAGLAYEEIILATKPGVRYSDLSKIGEAVAARLGGRTPFPGHVGSTSMRNPTRAYPEFYPSHRTVNAGDLVQTETVVGYGGYFSKIYGAYFVGEPTKEYRDLFELAASVHDTAIKELKPGMTGRDAKRYVQPIKEAGYTTRDPLVLGWSTMNQPPQAGALDGSPASALEKPSDLDFVFRPGICVCILAWVVTPDMKKGIWVGSPCVFTKDGIKEFIPFPVSKMRIV